MVDLPDKSDLHQVMEIPRDYSSAGADGAGVYHIDATHPVLDLAGSAAHCARYVFHLAGPSRCSATV